MSKHTSAQLSAMKSANQSRQCDVAGCTDLRHGIGHYCKAHSERKRRYGHPEGRRIRTSEYANESAMVELFLAKHSDHPAILAADSFASHWLASGGFGIPTPGAREADRLVAAGITGEEVITELLAVWLHLRWASRHVHWLGTAETQARAIGTAILHLAKREHTSTDAKGGRRYRAIGGRTRSDVGSHFVKALAPFATNVFQSIEQEVKGRNRTVADLRAPFGPTSDSPRKVVGKIVTTTYSSHGKRRR